MADRDGTGATEPTVVARPVESTEIERFLDAIPGGSRCLLLEGEVGIGKTTLLGSAKAAATDRGYRVLAASPVEMEVPWEFAALADLLGTVPPTVADALPRPQRQAIGVAVLRDEVSTIPVDPRTVATAVLRILRLLAAEVPVVLAIDDLPWLDLPSARVLSYVLRRAGDAAIGLLGAVRIEWSNEPVPLVTDSVEAHRVERVSLGPISLEAMGEMLGRRVRLPPGPAGLGRVHQLSRGNPLFALELVAENARDLVASADPQLGMPESLRRLVRRRVVPLSLAARDVLLVAALSGETSHAVVLAATSDPSTAGSALTEVMEAGLIDRGAGDITFAHPIIRSVIADDATLERRRATHRRLASVVAHPEVRARHLGLGAAGPDEDVARAVENAGVAAATRGAYETAATLAALAVSLTPVARVDAVHRRIILQADNWFETSESARASALLESVIEELPPGPARAELLRRLARYAAFRGEPFHLWIARLTAALDEAGEDIELRARIALDLGAAASNAGDQAAGWEFGMLALKSAERVGSSALEAQICGGLAFHAFISGEGVRHDLVARGLSGPAQHPRLNMELRPRVVICHLLHLSDDLDAARALYEAEYRRALAEGVGTGLPLLLWGMIETEAWAGNWDRAEELAAEGSELVDEAVGPAAAVMAGMNGLLLVYRGRIDEGLRQGELAVTTALKIGMPAAALLGAQALGLAGLSIGDAGAAHRRLAPLAASVQSVGIAEPGLLHFLPDEIEALIRMSEITSAEELLNPFETRSIELGRVWGMATSGRCRGLLLAARGDLDAADAVIGAALEQHRGLPMPFEHARTLLVSGELCRRARRKRRAREALEAAGAIFDGLGAPVWAQRARDELGRLGLRTPPSTSVGSELTEAEHRVAELVVAGHTNAEVAARLFMGQRTVEAHLSRIYRKLGVRSRTQLARAYPPSTSGTAVTSRG